MSNIKVFNQLVLILSASYSETNDVKSFIDNVKSKKGAILSVFNRDCKTSKKKDPNSPKKWRTSYIFFCSEHREKLKTDEPALSTTQIVSKLATIWRNLKDEDKQKYEKMAIEDKKRYEKEMEQYNPEKSQIDKPVIPKRPLTSYLFFCNETRDIIKKENPLLLGKQITTELGKRWKQLSDEEKNPYVEKQKLDRERYDNEKSCKQQSTEVETKETNKSKRKEKKPVETKGKKQVKEEPNKGKKPVKEELKEEPNKGKEKKQFIPSPGFKIFEQEQNEFFEEEHSEWSNKKIQSEILNNWNKLSKNEKEEYEVEANENNEEELLDE